MRDVRNKRDDLIRVLTMVGQELEMHTSDVYKLANAVEQIEPVDLAYWEKVLAALQGRHW